MKNNPFLVARTTIRKDVENEERSKFRRKADDDGGRTEDIRIENEVTGAQLGACLGINGNQVSRIETGVARCSIYQLVLICQEFGCSADYLLFGKRNTGMSKEQTELITRLYESIQNRP